MKFKSRLLIPAAVLLFLLPRAQAADWTQPVAALARKIAALAGPGQVQLTVQNRSSLTGGELSQIQVLLRQDLQGLGVSQGGSDSATQISVTLSENLHGGLWVAEVQEGTEVRVAMLPVKLESAAVTPGNTNITLQRTVVMTEPDPVLDAQVIPDGSSRLLVVLEPKQILIYAKGVSSGATMASAGSAAPTAAWTKLEAFAIPAENVFPRDMRGRVVAGQQHLFDVYLPGMLCSAASGAADNAAAGGAPINISCSDSDDPWPATKTQKAFYDSSRNYFMGVLVPGFNLQLAPFYEAAAVPRAGGMAMLLRDVDGPAVLIENDVSEPVSGTEDWGSDMAAIHSGCGTGTQLVVSGMGPATAGDSLRAYEVTGREAFAASAPLDVPGAVTAIWPAPGGNRATVVVRMQGNAGYEVWSVAASCD